jgi:hypothetical protein
MILIYIGVWMPAFLVYYFAWRATRVSDEEKQAIDACPSDQNIDRQIRETFLGEDGLARQGEPQSWDQYLIYAAQIGRTIPHRCYSTTYPKTEDDIFGPIR